ncbi:ethanolamine utilization sensor histidine kinase [Streptococcus ratti FA-1 = DSM 20564]|uniref:histidine kinase n=2 Tax=Streptococcus ratti TaxID=1341 RepID=A0ABN0GTT7_STRRT|nr:two-component sensor histidine kinase [Streptococcus ratti FA-1 = DSM 20564]EMP70608.1 ethanolamine utilization sensor histidine kinase [Streptococcus ratti FA-1 = DSM 20564]QEY07574.1 histidine kinase [Streptococcus ratti]VEI60031.1 sensor histidine kinase [Streptococcus mutans]
MNKMTYTYFEEIRPICSNQTDLSKEDIRYLELVRDSILQDCSNEDKDVFIDVRDRVTGEGLVVFHRIPSKCPSNYKQTVVGELAFRKDEPGVLRTLDTGRHSLGLYAQTQEGKFIEQDVSPIRSNGRIIGVIITEKDISAQILDTFELGNSIDHINMFSGVVSEVNAIDNTISDYLREVVLIFDKQGILIHCNQAAKEKYKEFGYINRLENLHYNNLTLDFDPFESVQKEFSQTGKNYLEKVVHLDYKTYIQKTIRLAENNLYVMLLTEIDGQFSDKVSKVENQEIHHRVKNSLQSIVSILRLQSRRVKSEEAKKVLNESINRVMAISAIHELLSKQKGNLVQLSLVLNRVISHLKRAYIDDNNIVLETSLDQSLVLNSDTTVTIALITNEIMQNSFEHAFDETIEKPKITVSLTKSNSNIELTISDNGVGFDHDAIDDDKLGIQLIKAFTVDKLKGDCSFDFPDTGGTVVKIAFNQTIFN